MHHNAYFFFLFVGPKLVQPTQITDFPQVTIVSITLENSKIEESHRIECSPLTLDTGQEEIQRIRGDHRSEQSSFF